MCTEQLEQVVVCKVSGPSQLPNSGQRLGEKEDERRQGEGCITVGNVERRLYRGKRIRVS